MHVPLYLKTPAVGIITTFGLTALVVATLRPYRDAVGLLNIGLILLLLVLLISAGWGRRVGLVAALLTNLALNFFFIEPVHTFTVQHPRNVIALLVFLIVSVVAGNLLAAARQSAAEARRRQAETEVALTLSRAMAGETEPDKALQALCREVTLAFATPGAAVLTPVDGGWSVLAHAGHADASRPPTQEERAAAERASADGLAQGLGAMGLDQARTPRIVFPSGRSAPFDRERSVALVPLKLGDRVLGVLRLDGPMGDSPFRSNPAPLLTAVTSEAAVAVQRTELAQAAAHAEALREADELKTALMTSISHDLKTPLAGIKAAISSLLDHRVAWSDEDVEAFHQTIDSQADRLNRLISDILDLNRIESGALTPDQTPLLARELLETARQVTSLETRGREVTVEAPDGLLVMTDESLITQALVNLIENAAKYSNPGGAIRLGARLEDGNVVFTVADEGPGIASEDLPYVFERFYRAEEHSRRIKGSGLGLTIVKGFVELCGGEVSVESSPAGTRFSIRLPAETRAQVPA